MKEVVWKAAALSPLAHAVDLVVGALTCFFIAYKKGDVSIYLPYISENGAIIPEMNMFSYVCILGSFIGVIVFLYRYLLVSYILEEEDYDDYYRLRILNCLSLLSGFVSMAGLAAVAAVPMSTLLYVHVVVAGFHFTFATIYAFVHSYISFKMKPPYLNVKLSKIRLGISLFLVPCLILITTLMPIGHFIWKRYYPDRPEAQKVPGDKMFGVLLCGSLAEWLWYLSWLVFLVTFLWENRKFELVVLVRQREVKAKPPDIYVNGSSVQVY